MKKVKIFILGLFFLVLSFSFVFGEHIIRTSTGGSSFSTNETIQTIYNISVNNTNAGQASNITSVNITLPSAFTFTVSTNTTSASESTFTNASNILSWTNTTGYVVNGSETIYFWFNATAATPGNYNFTIKTTNITDSYESNLSVEVNDTTNPAATSGTNPVDVYNSSSANVTFDIRCIDAYSANDLILYGNWSGAGWHANQTNASTTNNSYWNVTVLNIAEGTYKWAAYCNDTAGNNDWGTNRTLIVDLTNPTATASCTETTVNVDNPISCTCIGTDDLSGVASSTANSTPTTPTAGTYTYTCEVSDYAGNDANSSTATYTVLGSRGGGSTTGTSWSTTFTITDSQLAESTNKQLSVRQRLKVNIDSQDHYVGLTGITSTTATILVSSDPQEATLVIGEGKKFEVTDDNYYDLWVKLNSIANNKADITIQSINEQISVAPATEDGPTERDTDEAVAAGEEPDDISLAPSEGSKQTGLIIGIIIILIIIIIYFLKKKK